MILSKKESKILPQISFFVRWGSYLISVVVVIFLISNSLFIENRIRIVLNEINEFLFGIKQDYAVSQIQDIPIFLKGAITGALTPIDLKSISLNIEQEKLLNIYNTVENRSNREYLNAELMILDEYGTDSILKAKVRAKGDRSLHWEDVNNMSFRVNLRGDDRLFGLEEFSIQKPLLRNYIWEYFRQEGLLALKNEPIKFLVNGDRRGIYSVEEAPSKITIERQKRKNGPIYGLDEEVSIGLDSILDPYEEKDWIGLPIYELSKSSLYSEFINAQAGLPFTSKNFDMDEWARSMALHDLFGSYHGSVPKSVRFYFNPVIGKYQPLLFDIHIGAGNWKKFVVLDFILQPNLSSCEWLCDYKKF